MTLRQAAIHPGLGKRGRYPISCFDDQPCGKRRLCRARYRVASPFSCVPFLPIVMYYKYITRNPWLLIFVMMVTAVSIIAEIVFHMVPIWVGYSSIVLFAIVMLLSVLMVIPGEQRLASGRDIEDKQTKLAHSFLPYHILILILVLSLALLQFHTVPR
jgi:hypothetical protein